MGLYVLAFLAWVLDLDFCISLSFPVPFFFHANSSTLIRLAHLLPVLIHPKLTGSTLAYW